MLVTDFFPSGKIALYDNSGQTFGDVVVSSAVPEPGTFALIGSVGLTAAGFLRRRCVR